MALLPRTFLIAMLLLLLPFAATGANAAECAQRPAILALSDYALGHRAELPRFRQRQHGAIAAYLTIRYGDLGQAAVRAMLVPLVEAKVARADELAYTWALSAHGVADAARTFELDASSPLLMTSPSVLRALALAGDRQPLWAMLAAMPEVYRERAQTTAVHALLDQSDGLKEALTLEARRHRLIKLEAGLAATSRDKAAWSRFAGQVGDPAMLEQQVSIWRGTPALIGNPVILEPGASFSENLTRMSLGTITEAVAAEPERDFLMTYLNQSGRIASALVAAQAFLAETQKRGANDRPSMEESWLVIYRALATADDRKDLDGVLGATQFGGIRQYNGSVREVIDWMLAIEALGPYVAGKATAPALPAEAGKAFAAEWPLWKKIADALREGADPSPYAVDAKQRAIAAELLHAAGQADAMARLIAASPVEEASVSLAEDFAARLDRACRGYLATTAEAIVFPDTPIFRFETK